MASDFAHEDVEAQGGSVTSPRSRVQAELGSGACVFPVTPHCLLASSLVETPRGGAWWLEIIRAIHSLPGVYLDD